jgi:hypothetical protein
MKVAEALGADAPVAYRDDRYWPKVPKLRDMSVPQRAAEISPVTGAPVNIAVAPWIHATPAEPKALVVEHKTVSASVRSVFDEYGLDRNDPLLSRLSPPRHGTTLEGGSTSSQQARENKYQSACKPGSVWRRTSATAIHLGRRLLGASCNQPGQRRGSRLAHRANPPRRAAPIRFCSRWGLPCHLCCQRRGALLPHPFTLAAAGEPASAVCFLWHFPWGCPRRPLAATVDPWSPDFPPPRATRAASGSDRPAD